MERDSEEWVGPLSLFSLLIDSPSDSYEDWRLDSRISQLEQALAKVNNDVRLIEKNSEWEEWGGIGGALWKIAYTGLGAGASYLAYKLGNSFSLDMVGVPLGYLSGSAVAGSFIGYMIARPLLLSCALDKLSVYRGSIRKELAEWKTR